MPVKRRTEGFPIPSLQNQGPLPSAGGVLLVACTGAVNTKKASPIVVNGVTVALSRLEEDFLSG